MKLATKPESLEKTTVDQDLRIRTCSCCTPMFTDVGDAVVGQEASSADAMGNHKDCTCRDSSDGQGRIINPKCIQHGSNPEVPK